MICEKIYKPSSPTHCVQILFGLAYEFFRVILGSLDKGQKRANGDSSSSLGKGWGHSTLFFFVLFHSKHYNKKDN